MNTYKPNWLCYASLPAYICALQKEVPYHGRLYITDTHACFYSSVLLKDTKVDTNQLSIRPLFCLVSQSDLFCVCVCFTGSYSSFLHPQSEEAEHSFAGAQCLVRPHHRGRKGQSLTSIVTDFNGHTVTRGTQSRM